ncbi:hypothetical protein [Candidatus Chazhemtobacterium aquaticus]|nr:hypothetical protein [Candidatus Chazhemtobacterium aquaticus]
MTKTNMNHNPIKTLTILLLLIITLALLPLNLTLAQEDEATSSSTKEEIEKSLQDRIKKALDENLDTAQEVVEQSQLKAVVGVIDSLTQSQITVRVNPDTTAEYLHQVSFTSETQLTKSGKSIDSDDLEINSYIIAIGQPSSSTLLQADRIILDTYTKPSIYVQVAYATITDIDLDNDTITLLNSHPELEEPLDITSKTNILLNGQAQEISDLQPNQRTTVIFTVNESRDTVTLNTLIVFPLDPNNPTQTPTEEQASTCGDGICQNVACFGMDCPDPETPETCPADCAE